MSWQTWLVPSCDSFEARLPLWLRLAPLTFHTHPLSFLTVTRSVRWTEFLLRNTAAVSYSRQMRVVGCSWNIVPAVTRTLQSNTRASLPAILAGREANRRDATEELGRLVRQNSMGAYPRRFFTFAFEQKCSVVHRGRHTKVQVRTWLSSVASDSVSLSLLPRPFHIFVHVICPCNGWRYSRCLPLWINQITLRVLRLQ